MCSLYFLYRSSEDFKKIYRLEFASKQEWNKKIKAEMIKKLQERDGDTGSTPVQGTLLTNMYLHVLRDKLSYREMISKFLTLTN